MQQTKKDNKTVSQENWEPNFSVTARENVLGISAVPLCSSLLCITFIWKTFEIAIIFQANIANEETSLMFICVAVVKVVDGCLPSKSVQSVMKYFLTMANFSIRCDNNSLRNFITQRSDAVTSPVQRGRNTQVVQIINKAPL